MLRPQPTSRPTTRGQPIGPRLAAKGINHAGDPTLAAKGINSASGPTLAAKEINHAGGPTLAAKEINSASGPRLAVNVMEMHLVDGKVDGKEDGKEDGRDVDDQVVGPAAVVRVVPVLTRC